MNVWKPLRKTQSSVGNMAGRNVSDIPPMCMAQKPSFPLESQPPAATTAAAAEKIKLKTQQVYI